MKDALSGVRVIDLTQHIAGPYCTKLFSTMGGEVIKIEKPAKGDGARRTGPFPDDLPNSEKSGLFLYLNTGKKSITLNLKTNFGAKILKQLIKEADILVENFKPGAMDGMGLDYDALQKINPRLVMTSISNFGQSGPYRDYKAGEITLFALGGLMNMLGDAEREPLKFGGSTGQYLAGMAAFSGSMAALHHAEQTGRGEHVDISIMECLVSSHFQDIIEYSYTGRLIKRFRRMLIFPCKDGFVAAVVHQTQWPRLPKLLNMPELLKDPRFQTMASRRMHSDELEAYILPWMVERTKEEIYHAAQAEGIPLGYIATTKDLLSSRQYQARGYFIDIDHPVSGNLSYPGVPFAMRDMTFNQGPAPLLGEHNQEILCGWLNVPREDLAKLSALGIV